jgi:hypothetical protein
MKWFRQKKKEYTKRDPVVDRMRERELICMRAMGFDPDDPQQCWMRLHEVLLDYELRLKRLEGF